MAQKEAARPPVREGAPPEVPEYRVYSAVSEVTAL